MAKIDWTREAQIRLRDIYEFENIDILGVFHFALPIDRHLL